MADGDDPTPGLLAVAIALILVSVLVAQLPRGVGGQPRDADVMA